MDELDILLARSYNVDEAATRRETADEEAIVEMLRGVMSGPKLTHSLAVRDECGVLAVRYGADPLKARLAGLVHDCARDLQDRELLDAARRYGIDPDGWRTNDYSLLHAPIAAFLARDLFGIRDTDILHAIAVHTTGCVGMRKLDLILLVADYIEPNRRFPGVDGIRRAAKHSLELAALKGFASTMTHLLQSDRMIHPRTLEARNDLLTRYLESTARGPVRSDECGRPS